jgi:hypothetical protein
MDETTKVRQMVFMALSIMPPQTSKVSEDVLAILNVVSSSSESERWKTAGDELLEQAKFTSLDSDARCYIALGCAFLGHSIELARIARLRNGQ